MPRAPSLGADGCPYGDAPEIEIESDIEWTINGAARLDGDPQCQAIIASASACAGCSLNPANRPENAAGGAVSVYLSYILELENILNAGIPLGGFVLQRLERRALILVKTERQKFENQKLNQRK